MNHTEMPDRSISGIEDITRRDFLVGGAATLLLAGCGSDGGGSSFSGGTRTVEDAFGEVEVPARPQRVAALGNTAVETAVFLEAPMVAAPPEGLIGPWVRGDVGEVERVMSPSQEINVEALALAEPDLILVNEYQLIADLRRQLEEVAPLYVVPDSIIGEPDSWRKEFLLLAEALGKSEEAERSLSELDDRAEEIPARFPEAPDLTCAIIATPDAGFFRFHVPGSFSGDVADSTGIGIQPTGADDSNLEMSLEAIPEIDADFVFYWDYAFDEEQKEFEREARTEILGSPLWQRLEAVREDRVFMVGPHWNGAGPVSASLVLDDIESALEEVLA